MKAEAYLYPLEGYPLKLLYDWELWEAAVFHSQHNFCS